MAFRRLVLVSFSVILYSCLCFQVLAQQSGQTGSSSTDSGSGSRRGSGRGGRSANSGRMPLYIMGNVTLEDGTPPPVGVVIERVCDGHAARVAYPDPQGGFSFQVGADSGVIQDASDGPTIPGFDPSASPSWSTSNTLSGIQGLAGCQLRAILGGYRSSTLDLSTVQDPDSSQVGTIVLYPAGRATGTTVSITDLAAPKNARNSLKHGESALRKKDYSGAEKDLDTAVAAYPKYATAWFLLGQIYEMSQRNTEAVNAFAKAIEADRNYVGPYIELARMDALARKWQDAADWTGQALQLDPLDFPYGYYLDAVSNFNLNRLDAAEKSARMLERLDGQHRYPEVYIVLASVLRLRNDAAGEAAQLSTYLKFAPRAADVPQVKARLAQLSGSGQQP